MLVDLRFFGWPQRDLNPCYRLERADRGVPDASHEY